MCFIYDIFYIVIYNVLSSVYIFIPDSIFQDGRFSEASLSEVVRLEGINLDQNFISGKSNWNNCYEKNTGKIRSLPRQSSYLSECVIYCLLFLTGAQWKTAIGVNNAVSDTK